MTKDDATLLNFAYVVCAAIVAFVANQALTTLGIQTGWAERFDTWYPAAKNIGAIALGVGTTLWLRADKERHEYFLSAIGELRKVTWPSAQDTRKMTLIVCVVVGIFAVILAAFDFVWGGILKFMLT